MAKQRIDYFPFKPNQICGVGHAKLSGVIDFPEAHIFIFNKDEKIKTAYCLDFGLFVDGNSLDDAFTKIQSEIVEFLCKAYKLKNKTINLYALEADQHIWTFYRKLAQRSRNDRFFSQEIQSIDRNNQTIIREKEEKIKVLEKSVQDKSEIIKIQKELIAFLKKENTELSSFLFKGVKGSPNKNWDRFIG